MFIDEGSMVIVSDESDRMAGRFGKVQKIRIISGTGNVLVFVELFDPETGDSPVMMFDPSQLKRHTFAETSAKRLVRDPMKNQFILIDLANGVEVDAYYSKAAA